MASSTQRAAAPTLVFDSAFGHVPVYVHNELVLSGAVRGAASAESVHVEIEDQTYHAAHGLPRDGGDGEGFDLHLGTADWSPGRRPVRVVARVDGAELVVEGEVDVRPFANPVYTDDDNRAAIASGRLGMWCEAPALDGSARLVAPVWVEGWAFAGRSTGVADVSAYLDGVTRVPARHGFSRPDLRERLGDEAVDSGFVATLDPEECQPGWHTLTVIATSGDGQAIGVSGLIHCLAEADEVPADASAIPATLMADRYVPEVHVGYSFEPEHHARYRWAATLAPGKRVLDAGSGTGFGTKILAEAGARETDGFDVSLEAVEHARARAGDVAEFTVGDLKRIPFPDDQFDLVTCFEAIEHVDDPGRVLDELHRVLAPEGVLLVSTPNRGVYPEGNVHHLRELTSDEFTAEVRGRFANVRIFRQQTQATSLLCGDETFELADATVRLDLDVRKVTGGASGSELYAVAVASDGDLPALPELAVVGSAVDLAASELAVRAWRERALQAEAAAATDRVTARAAATARERALREREDAAQRGDAAEAGRARAEAERAAEADRRKASEAELARLRHRPVQRLASRLGALRHRLRRRAR